MSSKTPSVDLSFDEAKTPKPIAPGQDRLSDLANGLVGWDSLDDPQNPQNFKSSRKWFLLGLVSFITFLSPLASSIPAPGIGYTDKTFGVTSSILSSLAVSIFVLGFAIGPLILSPLSEIFGRQPVLNCSNFFFTIWQIGCALAPNMAALIVFRLLAGIGGSACLTVGGGIISDLFPLHQRGKANAIFTLGPLFGPVIGPIIGGFIAQRASWRWVYWVLLVACGVISSINLVTGQETNPVVLLRRKTQRLQTELQRPELRSVYELPTGGPAASPRALMVQSVTRPVRMLAGSPILLLLALYMSFVFGLLYLLFTTLTTLYVDTYGWPVDLCGLAYLGIGLGFGLGITLVAKTSDRNVMRLKKANGDVFEPEMRLATCLYFALFIPISFFWYGWTADKQVHWVVPIIGLLPFGFGMMGIFAPIQTYFIDVSGQYAASAVAGLTALRCLFGAFLPLAGPAMYEALGLGWGNSLLGFLALGLTPVPALIYRYGGALRRKHPIRLG